MSRRMRLLSALSVSTICLIALTGCGMGAVNYSVPDINYVATPMHGVSMGGNMPILNETVSVYVTSSAGYGVPTVNGSNFWQQQTTSDPVTGAWSFTGGYNCPAGQFVYIVGAGGNTGANAVNSNAVLVAALGRCDDLFSGGGSSSVGAYTGNPVYLNELSTIAAAYALGPFSSVSGTGASTLVLIGATSTNNAAETTFATCSSTYGVASPCSVGTTTAAAGLFHAFLNAASLVNAFTSGSTLAANIAAPRNSSTVVPQQLIDSMANSLVACVNSAGGMIGDGSACGQLLDVTSLPSGRVPAWTSATPTNTFSAMVNLAANPTLAGITPTAPDCASQTNIGCFFNLATPQTNVYSPVLSSGSGINDYSIAINYPAGTGASGSGTTIVQGLNYPNSGTLDVNDNFYVGNAGTGGSAVPVNVLSFASDGAFLSGTVNSNVSGSNLNSTSWKQANGISIDTNSPANLYIWNGNASGSHQGAVFTASSGVVSNSSAALITLPSSELAYYSAVDQHNNVWVLSEVSNAMALYEGTAGATASGSYTAYGSPGGTFPSGKIVGLSIDPDQNIWVTSAQTLTVLQNTNTAGSPTYTASPTVGSGLVQNTSLSGNPAGGIAFAGSPFKAYVSYYNTTPGIQSVTPTLGGTNGIEVTSVSTLGSIYEPGTTSTGPLRGSFYNEADGAGNIWIADTNGHQVSQYNPTANSAFFVLPCIGVSGGGNTTCATVFGGKPLSVSVDSTGAVWVIDGTGQNIVQIIGAAAPTWPQLSQGKIGTP